ncbi:hypothetical protein MVEN_01156500 [Mycena venus]|uniref:SnoaL-like domain-containing protein n=1 Tax=Mycena venus TaxID=2733690 RepID=A0A8H6Y0T2_9AGAR|nr:hypothetical protein MVEN_01156500 [Mycena venus]
MSDTHATQLENAHAFMKHLNALDWTSLADLMSPDFRHQYLPASIIPLDGKEDRGKEEFIGILKHYFEIVFEKVTFLPPTDVIHGSNAVVFHLKADGMSKSGKKYNSEYMFTFHFDGEKIVKLNEFVDSKYSSAYFTTPRAESAPVA